MIWMKEQRKNRRFFLCSFIQIRSHILPNIGLNYLQRLMSENSGSSTPGGLLRSHWLMRLTVMIFGEIPCAAITPLSICRRQRAQQMSSTLQVSITCQPHGIQSSQYRPESAIVIGIGLIFELIIEVVCLQCGPGRVTRLNNRPEGGQQCTTCFLFQLLNIFLCPLALVMRADPGQ